MIEKRLVNKNLDAYYWIESILRERKEFYLTKEEIYADMPKDDREVPLITIGAFTNALRHLAHLNHIEVAYIGGKAHYTYVENPTRY